jgi:Dissimilatory sulfite reductase D (DsrD)
VRIKRRKDMEDLKKAILEFAETNKKTKFYFQDMEKGVQKIVPGAKAREIKKAATALVNEEKLIYFSTGSSTMYGLKGRGQTEDH